MSQRARLLELIKNSTTFNSLPEEVRDMRTDTMLAADSETLEKFVEVMENEAKETAALDASIEKNLESIEEINTEIGQMENVIKQDAASIKEKANRKNEDARADALLKELDSIA